MSSDDVEGMTWALSFGHQIVNLSISLPACLYIAMTYAERGRAVYAEYIHKDLSSSENTSEYDDAMRLLCYSQSRMGNNRITA